MYHPAYFSYGQTEDVSESAGQGFSLDPETLETLVQAGIAVVGTGAGLIQSRRQQKRAEIEAQQLQRQAEAEAARQARAAALAPPQIIVQRTAKKGDTALIAVGLGLAALAIFSFG